MIGNSKVSNITHKSGLNVLFADAINKRLFIGTNHGELLIYNINNVILS